MAEVGYLGAGLSYEIISGTYSYALRSVFISTAAYYPLFMYLPN